MTYRGHDDAWRAWRGAIASERMPHAWLLTGPRGLGKAAFARDAAATLVAEPGVRQPATAAHPDIVSLVPLPDGEEETRKRDEGLAHRVKRNITVDQVRAVQARLTMRPTLGARRAVIVDSANELERSAANALLKSLEEPPQGTVFLLVAHRAGALLATLRSRCRPLRFATLADTDVRAVIAGASPEADAESRAAALFAARGAPGAALDFVARDLGAAFAILRRILADGDGDLALRSALVAALGPRFERGRVLAALDLARALLAAALPDAPRARQAAIVAASTALDRRAAQAPTYNFDPALLLGEIGGLLAAVTVATASARAV